MNVCLHGKLCKNSKKLIYQKKQTKKRLFVETPRYKGQWTGLRL